MKKKSKPALVLAETALKRHFGKTRLHDLVTSSRTFPVAARVDTQFALDRVLDRPSVKLYGVHRQFTHETLTFANLMQSAHDPAVISPLQYEEVDIGDTMPARCLRQGIWLAHSGTTPFAVLMSSAQSFGRPLGGHLEIAAPPGEAGATLSRHFFAELEAIVKKTASY